jgi:DNA-binding transcriptional ArsR family regulator
MTDSHIARAVAELEAEELHLAARLEKVRTAIAAVRSACHLPATRKAPATRTKRSEPSADGNGRRRTKAKLSADAVRAALRNGPLSPGELVSALGIERAQLRRLLVRFEEQGLVTSTGATASRRIALAAATEGRHL